MDKQGTITPFSNGTQALDWECANCDRCKKSATNLGLPAHEMPTCEIEIAIVHCGWGEKMTVEMAGRMGYTENKGEYNWMCNEAEWTEEWKAECMRRRAREETV